MIKICYIKEGDGVIKICYTKETFSPELSTEL